MATVISIPTGSVTLFRQATAPVKWTKNTNFDDYALRVTSGTPGTGGNASVSFTTLNSTNVNFGVNFTINSASVNNSAGSLSPHTHATTGVTGFGSIIANHDAFGIGASYPAYTGSSFWRASGYGSVISGAAGGGTGHTHTVNGPLNGLPYVGSANYNFPFSIQYIDIILCTRTG